MAGMDSWLVYSDMQMTESQGRSMKRGGAVHDRGHHRETKNGKKNKEHLICLSVESLLLCHNKAIVFIKVFIQYYTIYVLM
jgi:hypothetical protein